MITSKSYFNVQGKREDDHPRLSHGLNHWFLLDLVLGAPVPAYPGAAAFPWEPGPGRTCGRLGWRGGGWGKPECNTQFIPFPTVSGGSPCVQGFGISSDLLLSIPEPVFFLLHFVSVLPNRGSHIPQVFILNLLSFPNFNFSLSYSPTLQ